MTLLIKTLAKTSLLALLIFSACTTIADLNHQTISLAKYANNDHYKVDFVATPVDVLYEIEFKCINPMSYSKDSMVYVSHKLIPVNQLEEVILIQDNNGFSLKAPNNIMHTSDFPTEAQNRRTSISMSWANCLSIYNEISRIEYNLPNDSNPQHNHIKVLAYSTSPFSQMSGFDWNYFFNNPKNIFDIYTLTSDCNHDWDLKLQ